MAVAFGGDVTPAFFEAVTETPEQAREMAEATTRKRQRQQAVRKFRGGGR